MSSYTPTRPQVLGKVAFRPTTLDLLGLGHTDPAELSGKWIIYMRYGADGTFINFQTHDLTRYQVQIVTEAARRNSKVQLKGDKNLQYLVDYFSGTKPGAVPVRIVESSFIKVKDILGYDDGTRSEYEPAVVLGMRVHTGEEWSYAYGTIEDVFPISNRGLQGERIDTFASSSFLVKFNSLGHGERWRT